MRVVLAFDKFKDSLSAGEACATAAAALRARHPDWTLDLCPLTDGGEGFCEILTNAAGGTFEKFPVSGPRGDAIDASIGFVAMEKIPPSACALLGIENQESKIKNSLAVIEMASASGLALLPAEQRDPWRTSSLGTGQLIRHAAERGASTILLGIGGSATHDLGLGALHALGVNVLDGNQTSIAFPCPDRWSKIARITGTILPTLSRLRIACDVRNPLLGPQGAATVFAPQKGLRSADLGRLEHATARMALMLTAHFAQPDSLMDVPGTGAAGGIAFGLMTAARAQLVGGFDLVSAWLNLDARVAAADLVLTGEGRFDASSLAGKGPGAIVARACALGKPVHVFAGSVAALAAGECHLLGDIPSGAEGLKLHAISPVGATLGEALRAARENLAAAVSAEF